MRILHCSDVHVTHDYMSAPWRIGWRRWLSLLELYPGGRARAYARADETLRVIAEDVARHEADHLVLSGDLTAYALEPEFARARAALGAAADDPARCTVVPGNHDTFTPGAVGKRRFERHFGHLLGCDLTGRKPPEPGVEPGEPSYPFVRLLGEEAAVVGLCSARVPTMPGLAFGTLGRRQLARLREIVADPRLAGRAVLVAVHHAPLGPRGAPEGRMHGLLDGGELLAALPGPRFAVLHGHIHRRYHHPATASRPHLFGAGSSTERGREGCWLIELGDGAVRGGRIVRPGEASAQGTP